MCNSACISQVDAHAGGERSGSDGLSGGGEAVLLSGRLADPGDADAELEPQAFSAFESTGACANFQARVLCGLGTFVSQSLTPLIDLEVKATQTPTLSSRPVAASESWVCPAHIQVTVCLWGYNLGTSKRDPTHRLRTVAVRTPDCEPQASSSTF